MLEGKTVRLRSIELADVDELLKGWNDLELRNLVGAAAQGPMSRWEEEEWIRSIWREKQAKTRFTFAIERIEDRMLLGTTGLFNINWVDKSAVCGIDVAGRGNWGKGYGSEAMRLLLDFAFKSLNLHRVELNVMDFNERAQRCYRKVGFKEVGRKRQARFIDGKYHDAVLMDVLRDEWS